MSVSTTCGLAINVLMQDEFNYYLVRVCGLHTMRRGVTQALTMLCPCIRNTSAGKIDPLLWDDTLWI
jgi:hypothetical protein